MKKKQDRENYQAHPIKVNVWGCFSSRGLGRMVCFKQNLNAELTCDISKRGLLSAAQKQFDYDSSLWRLQEDNSPKHTWKLAVSWKRNNGVDEIDCPSISADLSAMENIRQLLKMNLRRKKIGGYQPLVSAIKKKWESLPLELTLKLVHSTNNRISEVIESYGDFILR